MKRIAVPITADGLFCAHLGRCDGLWLAEIDRASRTLLRPRSVRRPRSECDQLADWIQSLAVQCLLTQGAGAVALSRLGELGIEVVTGLTGSDPEAIVEQYLRRPEGEANACKPKEHRFRHCRE